MQDIARPIDNNVSLVKKPQLNGQRSDHVIPASKMSKNTINDIRRIVEQMKIEPNPLKKLIPLSIGDPTSFGNLKCDNVVTEAVVDAVRSGKFNGYAPAMGYEVAREAVAKYSSCQNYTLNHNDILITSGCSTALEHCILVLANPGQNIIIPRPGFPLYNTLCHSSDIKTKYYDLMPDKDWEVDTVHMESVIDENTVAILINNPSNPCGSVFTKEHLKEVLEVAERRGLPVIADEIYHNFIFEGPNFEYMASINDRVPILSCSGLTKRFLIPGWRLGWIAIYDRFNRFKEVRQGLVDLATRTLGANTLVQGALPKILFDVTKEHFSSTLETLKNNFEIVKTIITRTRGLKLVKPQGAMYAMVQVQVEKFPVFISNIDFITAMIKEESVFCLPSEPFGLQNYFRILLTVPPDIMSEACERIESFCSRHIQEKENK